MKNSFVPADFLIQWDESSGWRITSRSEVTEDGIEFLHLDFHSETPLEPPQAQIIWKIPMLDIQVRWTPLAGLEKNVPPEWSQPSAFSLAIGAPVMAFCNQRGENQLTYAVSDAMRTVKCGGGVNEEKNLLVCKVILFSEPESPISDYRVTLRLDWRNCFYVDSIRDVSDWYAGFSEYRPREVPAAAFEPFYSTWYSYHQNLFAAELEKECALAADAGLRGVIVDDGWQTDDNNRGYAFCGDWLVSQRRFPDMKKHVENIHKLGMKYLMWYGVSVMGFKSANYPRFADKCLYNIERNKTAILDPRFPEVRDFLIQKYETALKEWNLDGFKLDFIDIFKAEGVDPAIAQNYAGRDIKSIPMAVDRLLSDVITRLKAIKPDILIEFRQNYIGPAVRKYGNIFRAADCPADIAIHRVRMVDLRLFSGNTAVHSDMLEWNMASTAEVAARQLLNVIFSVPQISIRFAELPPEHRKRLSFWLNWLVEQREVLLQGRFMPYHPELNYPVISAVNGQKKVTAIYQANLVIDATRESKELWIINASAENSVVLDVSETPREAALWDTMGNAQKSPPLTKGLNKVTIPCSGLMKIVWK